MLREINTAQVVDIIVPFSRRVHINWVWRNRVIHKRTHKSFIRGRFAVFLLQFLPVCVIISFGIFRFAIGPRREFLGELLIGRGV